MLFDIHMKFGWLAWNLTEVKIIFGQTSHEWTFQKRCDSSEASQTGAERAIV